MKDPALLLVYSSAFALGFYAVIVLAIRHTRRLTGKSPLVVLQRGSPEEMVSVLAMGLFPVALVVSALLQAKPLLRPLMYIRPLHGAGAILLLSCLALHYVSIRTMGRAFRIGIDPDQRDMLVRGGPYKYVRHPIYAAFIGYFVGAWMLQPNFFFTIVLPLAVARIVVQASREEQALISTFGRDYRDYMKSTKRFIPGIL